MFKRTKSGLRRLLAILVLLAYLIGGGANPSVDATEPNGDAKKTSNDKNARVTANGEATVDRTKRRIERPLEFAIGQASNEIPAIATKLDVSKSDLETPLKLTIAGVTPRLESIAPQQSSPWRTPVIAKAVIHDVGKGFIERPIKSLLVDRPLVPENAKVTSMIPAETEKKVAATTEPSASDDNPKVAPGKVTWHEDFEAACAASSESGKPVLLFQLLGQLDQRFT